MSLDLKTFRLALTIAPLALLAACASPGREVVRPDVRTAPVPPSTNPTVPQHSVPGLQIMREPGLEGVIGATASQLTSRFGTPRLNVAEGDARKLQWVGEPCVLDIFLYPVNGAQIATWVEARRRSDGRDVDRGACVSAMGR